MKAFANKWWFALTIMTVYLLSDMATNVLNFASSLPDDVTFESISFKQWWIFIASTVGSAALLAKTYMSSTWSKAKEN